MATNQKELASTLSKEAMVFVGKSPVKDKYLVIVRTNKKNRFLGVSVTSKAVQVYCDKETYSLRQDIFSVLDLVLPVKNKDKLAEIVDTYPDEFLTLEKDINHDLYEQSIKVLPWEYVHKKVEVGVKNTLDEIGVDYSLYTYTEIKVDNSCNTSSFYKPLPRGYNSYPDEVKAIMANNEEHNHIDSSTRQRFAYYFDLGKHLSLAGPPGVGKSWDVVAFGTVEEIPVITCIGGDNAGRDDLIGCQAFKQDGTAGFVLGPVGVAIKYGCICVIDEATSMQPDAIITLNAATDASGKLQLSNGEVLDIHPNFRLVITSNPGGAGSKLLPKSTLSRFVSVIYPKITEQQFMDRMQYNVGNFAGTKFLKELFKTYEKVSTICETSNYDIDTTIREFITFLQIVTTNPNLTLDEWKEYFKPIMTGPLYTREQIDYAEIEASIKEGLPMVESLFNTFNEGKEVAIAEWEAVPSLIGDLDDIDNALNDFGIPAVEEDE